MTDPIIILITLLAIQLLLYSLQARRSRENSANTAARIRGLESEILENRESANITLMEAWDAAQKARESATAAKRFAPELLALVEKTLANIEDSLTPSLSSAFKKIDERVDRIDLVLNDLIRDMAQVFLRNGMRGMRSPSRCLADARIEAGKKAPTIGELVQEGERRDIAKTLGVANNPRRAKGSESDKPGEDGK